MDKSTNANRDWMGSAAVCRDLAELIMPRRCLVCGRPLWGCGRVENRGKGRALLCAATGKAAPFRADPPGTAHSGGLIKGAAPFRADPPLCPDCAALLRPGSGARCERCGKVLISEDRLCMRCRGREWAFDSAYPLFNYLGRAEALISAYKFGGRLSLAPFFCTLLAQALTERWPGWPLVPVPPRPGKIRRQGWDQVELLARGLERRGFTVLRLLERRPSLEQKKLGLEARFENARCAYGLRRGLSLSPAGLSLVLLDDVFTTGATAEACALALKNAGASHVGFISIAAD